MFIAVYVCVVSCAILHMCVWRWYLVSSTHPTEIGVVWIAHRFSTCHDQSIWQHEQHPHKTPIERIYSSIQAHTERTYIVGVGWSVRLLSVHVSVFTKPNMKYKRLKSRRCIGLGEQDGKHYSYFGKIATRFAI